MWGAQEKSEGAHQKIFGRRFAPELCPHLQIASDTTVVVYTYTKIEHVRICRYSLENRIRRIRMLEFWYRLKGMTLYEWDDNYRPGGK